MKKGGDFPPFFMHITNIYNIFMCMKFEKLSLLNLIEQEDDNWGDNWGNEGPDDDELDNVPNDDEPDDANPEHQNNIGQQNPEQPEQPKPQKAKPLSPIQRLKIKWKEENPALTDGDMNGAIESFNLRKNNLRPLSNNPEIRNMPEVLALKARFPNFPAGDIQKLKDITTYTWDQLEFFLDRFSERDIQQDLDWDIIGDTPEERWKLSMEKWEKSYNKILDEDGLIVHVIHSQEEAVALGQVQQKLAALHGGNSWCVTYAPGQTGSNLYTTYRSYRAFYFIMDKKRDVSDNYFISSIQVVDPNTDSYRAKLPYCVTPRSNHQVGNQGSEVCGVDWDYIVDKWPGLKNKQNLFKWFGETKQEKKDVTLNMINFRQGDQNDFAIQPTRIQRMYIQSNRVITSPRAFLTLNAELQHEYVARTTFDDYKLRFKSDSITEPFAMLDALSKSDLKFLDNFVLKTQLGIRDGVYAIKGSILKSNYTMSYGDITNKGLTLFSSNFNENIFGVMDLNKISWIKDVKYLKGSATTLFDKETRTIYILRRYTSDDDYFYFLFTQKDLKDKNSPNYLKGKFYDGKDGDEIMRKYPKLG